MPACGRHRKRKGCKFLFRSLWVWTRQDGAGGGSSGGRCHICWFRGWSHKLDWAAWKFWQRQWQQQHRLHQKKVKICIVLPGCFDKVVIVAFYADHHIVIMIIMSEKPVFNRTQVWSLPCLGQSLLLLRLQSSKVRSCLSMKKLFDKVMTQIWDKRFAANISIIKFADIKPNVMKCEKWASVKPDFLCGEVTQRFQKNHNWYFDWGPIYGEIYLLK